MGSVSPCGKQSLFLSPMYSGSLINARMLSSTMLHVFVSYRLMAVDRGKKKRLHTHSSLNAQTAVEKYLTGLGFVSLLEF